MAVRIKEWMIPYTWGVGIEITNNHIINVLLREANNLIHVNENRELYVDLQLDDWIQPDDDFPVGVTTGKILEEDWWQQSWLILNWKTTSGDYARLIYANDWNLYVDLWDGQWLLLMNGWGNGAVWGQITWYLRDQTDLAQALDEKVNLGVNNIFDWTKVTLNDAYDDGSMISVGRWVELDPTGKITTHQVTTSWAKETQIGSGDITLVNRNAFWAKTATIDHEKLVVDGWTENKTYYFLWQHRIATLDDLNFAWAMTYKWNVTSSSQLPSSWQQVWDCWYDESDHTLWAWDWTSWKDVGGTGIDLTNYFNMQVNTSDDITEWSIHLFCTAIEKNYWNSKQDALTAWNGIQINNNIISAKYTAWNNISIDSNFAINNDAPFDPDNAGTMGQILQKTNDWYEWKNFPSVVNSVNGRTGTVTVEEFLPWNWTAGQVLKKTQNGYEWSNETAWSYNAWSWININQSTKTISNALPFDPTNTASATVGQVLKLGPNGTYSWQNESWGWGGWGTTYYGWDYINISSSNYINNTAPFVPTPWWSTWQVLTKTSNGYEWDDIDLPSGENNVKFWTINSATVGASVLQEIATWVQANPQNWAIINDTNPAYKDFYVFHGINTTWAYPVINFFGTKRVSRIKEWVTNNQSHWWYTSAWQWEMDIITWPNYWIYVWENPDDDTHTNYISALGANYPSAFTPTEDYQPATKWYVDDAIQGGWTPYTAWAGISISNNVISNIWVLSGDSWVTYTVKVANSAPASWTASNIITFVI